MTTYSTTPIYYQVTFTLPPAYASFTDARNGGLDPVTAWGVNETISITGATAVVSTVMAEDETLLINGYTLVFSSTDTLANIITKINSASRYTNVIADQSVAGTYITLKNAPLYEGVPISLVEGNGTALAKLGLTAGVYKNYPTEIGSAFSSVTTGSNVTVNGYNLVFTAGNLASTVTQLNSVTNSTGLVAAAAGPYLQLSSNSGQPWVINSGNAVANLGTTLGVHGGYPTTLSNSLAKERSNIRWNQTINELSSFANPIYVGSINRTGNIGNVAPSSVTFTVGYQSPDQVVIVADTTEPDAGNVLVGTEAVKRAVARALTSNIGLNRNVFDPTVTIVGSSGTRVNPAQIQNVTASALDIKANIAIVESNLTVTQISGV